MTERSPLGAAKAILLSAALGASVPAWGQSAPAPTLTYAFSAEVEIAAPVEQGEIDGGSKRFIPITGGTVSGPRLSGVVLGGGGDWQTIFPGGVTRVEARYFIKTPDGTVIGIHNQGVRVATPEVTDRIAHGEKVDPGSYYFRSAATFDPPPGPHGWLRTRTFVGRGIRLPDRVIIDFYTVE